MGLIDYAVLKECPPCPRCLKLAWAGRIRLETVQPLPLDAPLAIDGSGPCCYDCQAADNLQKILRNRERPELEPRTQHALRDTMQIEVLDEGWSILTFVMARVCVGNDRQEQLRLPGMPMGLAHPSVAIIKLSQGEALTDHHAWMDSHGLKPHWGD